MDLVCLTVALLSDHYLPLWVIVCACERGKKNSTFKHDSILERLKFPHGPDLPLDMRTAFRFDLAEKTSPMVGPCRTRNDHLLEEGKGGTTKVFAVGLTLKTG